MIVYMNDHLARHRMAHSLSVAETARTLSERFGADPDKAEEASLLHDICRGMRSEDLDALIERYDLPDRLKGNINLSHGKIAAEIARDDLGVEDRDVLNAICFHTTGRECMSTLEKIVFLADAIEPDRNYAGVDELRATAEVDLDEACLLSLENTIRYITEMGIDLDPDSVLARDALIKNLRADQ